jgi:EAL domain-containing protein (putative c-di-GMP-specific phosphodiesterase class I)/chaperonin cofactor prefoldin
MANGTQWQGGKSGKRKDHERRRKRVWGPRMILILMAMLTVSMAFFSGLYLQGGLPVIPSLIAAVALFVALFGTIPKSRPSQAPAEVQARLAEFETEIDRLTGQFDQFQDLSLRLGELDEMAPAVQQIRSVIADMQHQNIAGAAHGNEENRLHYEELSQKLRQLDGRITSLNREVVGVNEKQQIELQNQISELHQMVHHMAEQTAATSPRTRAEPAAKSAMEVAEAGGFAPDPGEVLKGQNEHTVRQVRRSIERAQNAPLGTTASDDPAGGAPLKGSEQQLLAVITSAIKERRMEIFLQPVVTLPGRKIIYYEVFTRLKNEQGGLIMPEVFVPVAERAGLMPLIDNMMLLRAIKIIRQMDQRTSAKGLFCSLSTQSLVDPDFFPQLVAFLERNRDLAGRIIFEISQAQKKSAGHIEREGMQRLAKLGFSFSLDKVIDLDIDYNDLSRRSYKFVRISAERLIHGMADLGARIHGADKAHYLERYGIQLIVERIETERELAILSDYNIKLGQGYLFAEPRPVRPEVMGERAA